MTDFDPTRGAGGIDGLVSGDNLNPLGPVCTTHIELVQVITNLCSSLRWVIWLGIFMIPYALAVGGYVILQSHVIDNRMVTTETKLQAVTETVKINTEILRNIQLEQVRCTEIYKQLQQEHKEIYKGGEKGGSGK